MLDKTCYSPRSMETLADLLRQKQSSEKVYFVAGGTDFAVTAKKTRQLDFTTIDLTKIDAMKQVELMDGWLEIGSCVTLSTIEKAPLVHQWARGLAQAAARVGSVQIRNRGTIGGNIANAAQCADTLPVLFACGAEVLLYNQHHHIRTMKAADFVIGFGDTQLQPDEVLYKVRIPVSASQHTAFSKVGSRKTVTISKLNCGVAVTLADQQIQQCRVYLGSIGPSPVPAVAMEAYLQGKNWSQVTWEALFQLGAEAVDQTIPNRPSRPYKRTAVKGLIEEVFHDLKEQGGDKHA